MDNKSKRKTNKAFEWESLGDVKFGRNSMGEEMPVVVYRLMQFSLMSVLDKKFGGDTTDNIFREVGFVAGSAFAKNALDMTLDLQGFVERLKTCLKEYGIGLMDIETIDPESGEIVLTVGEDLDCSGLSVTDEFVCVYDEGFIEGILQTYTGRKYNVREISCWASGDLVCRFRASPM